MSKDKANLRKIAKTVRNALTNLSEKNCKIREKVLKLLYERNVKNLFCYVSIGSEVDTIDLIRNVFGKIEVFVPYTYDERMIPVRLDSPNRLFNTDKHGNVYRYGEPLATDLLSVNADGRYCVDVTVVPMLAFNDELYRLGYGGGYYDKFLTDCDTEKIGVAFDEQKTTDFEAEDYDVALDAIVTQSKVFRRQ